MTDEDLDTPFVPKGLPFVDHSRGADDVREECRRLAREGAAAVHARAAGADSRRPPLTDAESAARARKRIDDEEARR